MKVQEDLVVVEWKVIAKVVQSNRADHYPVSDITPHHLANGLHSSLSRLGLIMVAIKHNSGYNRPGIQI